MTNRQAAVLYLKYLKALVCDDYHNRYYTQLLKYLHSREFTWIIDMDSNRAAYGIELRNRFVTDGGYSEDVLWMLDGPCSVLEFLVALAVAWEDQFLWDGEVDHTSECFWEMIDNLGLTRSKDHIFDEDFVGEIVDILLERRYQKDGKGGLFYIPGVRKDMRNTEIWYQLNWYINYKEHENR